MRKTSILCSAVAVAGFASAAAFYGCTPQGGSSSNDPVAAGAGSSSDASLNVQVSLVDAKGAAHANNMFAAKADVWMELQALVSQSGPLPAGRVVYIVRQACASLEEAHARGLVHRDIKPANIHVGRVARPATVKVTDDRDMVLRLSAGKGLIAKYDGKLGKVPAHSNAVTTSGAFLLPFATAAVVGRRRRR